MMEGRRGGHKSWTLKAVFPGICHQTENQVHITFITQ